MPVARKDYDDEVYRTIDEKYNAIIDLIEECNKRGQPMLVGTTSIEKSEQLHEALKKRKVKHNVLERALSRAGSPHRRSGRPATAG